MEIAGCAERFPVHRIYCVGRNYAAHVREMGKDPERDPPFFFLKPTDSLVPNGGAVPYPPRTRNLHHEIELVVAIGRAAHAVPVHEALDYVFGYAVGNDITRRDLQLEARDKGRPWDTGKAVDHSAALSAVHPVEQVGHVSKGRIWLNVNGQKRQESDLSAMIWSVPEIVAELSTYYRLCPGDLVYTGTPEGVGPMSPGDRVEGGIEGLDRLVTTIVPAEAG